jgi:deazaflavin-dependent oxidoreductase (nitroreductase family)
VSGSHRYLKPGWLVSRVLKPVLMRLGIVPTLAVRGRTSGGWRTVPVNVLELAGQRYLVAPRGDTQWVRNLRATGRGELRRRGRTEAFRAAEIADDEKPHMIEMYLAGLGLPGSALFQDAAECGRSPRVQDRATVTERRSRGGFHRVEHSGIRKVEV